MTFISSMLSSLFFFGLLGAVTAQNGFEIRQPRAIHFTIERRDGAFAPNWTSNLDFLAEQLKIAEARFNLTRREVKGNKVVRVPKTDAVGGEENNKLNGDYGRSGNWFATLKLGEPAQQIEMDTDLLTADFVVKTTSSNLGSRFEDFFSKTYKPHPLSIIPFPNCLFPSDKLTLPLSNKSLDIFFPHCKPRRQSRATLGPSGAVFGLAPSESLAQIKDVPTFMQQLIDANQIEEPVFSLTLINGQDGILSVGGTISEQITKVESEIENFLGRPARQEAAQAQMKKRDLPPEQPENQQVHQHAKRQDPKGAGDTTSNKGMLKVPTFEDFNPFNRAGRQKVQGPHIPTWRDEWKWSPVEGAAGWWQILMKGIWTDQVKIMKNQPCIIDLNTPFILAPPLAAKAFYASISGSYRLPAPYSNFYAYPCNNPPFLHFEFGGWRFPVMRGTKSPYEHRGANGKFSLGKVSEDSGYCIGAVVESRMGVGDYSPVKKNTGRDIQNPNFGSMESGMLAGNGLRDVWVLGEPMFRGMGLVFDMKTKEVGFRTY